MLDWRFSSHAFLLWWLLAVVWWGKGAWNVSVPSIHCFSCTQGQGVLESVPATVKPSINHSPVHHRDALRNKVNLTAHIYGCLSSQWPQCAHLSLGWWRPHRKAPVGNWTRYSLCCEATFLATVPPTSSRKYPLLLASFILFNRIHQRTWEPSLNYILNLEKKQIPEQV